jgi:DnaJ-class molecular chaperone
MRTEEVVEQMNVLSSKQAKMFQDKMEQTLMASMMTTTSSILNKFPPQNVRCPKCSDWKVSKGTYSPGKQPNAREDCTYCNGSGIMPIPLSEFDVLS